MALDTCDNGCDSWIGKVGNKWSEIGGIEGDCKDEQKSLSFIKTEERILSKNNRLYSALLLALSLSSNIPATLLLFPSYFSRSSFANPSSQL